MPKDTTIKFRADDEILDKLDFVADKENKSRSEIIRQGIENMYLAMETTDTVVSNKGKRVVELFAGVGGFHLGLSKTNRDFNVIWGNQWEPGKSRQYAFDCYKAHFGEHTVCVNEDIAQVKHTVPEHDLLVLGAPCQDYSVAHTGAKGIQGKKGVLWWEVRDILEEKRPPFVLFENVDRLLKSPASQRGRDFAIMLWCFNNLGYSVEWRVINAAEYGFVQRRRRVFMIAYHNSTAYAKSVRDQDYEELIRDKGLFAQAFPVEPEFKGKSVSIDIDDVVEVSDHFAFPFENGGIMRNAEIFTASLTPKYVEPKTLKDILESDVDEKYYLGANLEKWQYLKGAKKIERTANTGHKYIFSEGAIAFPDPIDKPARTMLTSESSLNRSTHVIEDPQTHKLRLLTPMECERINGFDDSWTDTQWGGMPQKFRYFCMGNALVVGIVERLGYLLADMIDMDK